LSWQNSIQSLPWINSCFLQSLHLQRTLRQLELLSSNSASKPPKRNLRLFITDSFSVNEIRNSCLFSLGKHRISRFSFLPFSFHDEKDRNSYKRVTNGRKFSSI
jgi:hypothetical protein